MKTVRKLGFQYKMGNMRNIGVLLIISLLVTSVKGLRVRQNGNQANVHAKLDKIDEEKDDQSLTRLKSTHDIPGWYSSPEECKRDCTRNEYPKVCYFKFVVEYYTVNGGACQICRVTPETPGCECVLADGVEKTIVVANRRFPGPPIEVCLGDTVIIDVVNSVPGAEVTIHWHGVLQHGTPYFDGVPYVTQCPIHYGDTFRYRWYATNEGTHFWHSHTGFQKLDGLSGSIVVRSPCDVHAGLYDYDHHTLMIHDWMHHLAASRFPGLLTGEIGQDPDNLLINGKGQFIGSIVDTPVEVFEVTAGKKYRFRMITATTTTCPVQMAIQGHKLLAIATDGEPFDPVEVDTIRVFSAERYDFIINANRRRGSYWIQIKSVGLCEQFQLSQLAILKYIGSNGQPATTPPTHTNSLPEFNGKVLNPADGNCDVAREGAICVGELTTADPPDNRIAKQPDVKIFLPFRFLVRNLTELFMPGSFGSHFMVAGGGFHLTAFIDGVSFDSPDYPVIIQMKENEPIEYCNKEHMSEKCSPNCVCTHLIPIPYGSLVEIIMVDEVAIPRLAHPFHLHGYAFHVVSEGWIDPEYAKMDLRTAVELDRNEQMPRRLADSPRKDTTAVPSNGYVALRFIADNAGAWFFHCHFMYHMAVGMELVLQVGNSSQIPPIPKGFPRCGSFVPQDW